MLNVFRRHIKKCAKAGSRSADCPSRPKCPIHFEGIDGRGLFHSRQRLIDPESGSGVRDWGRAVEITRLLELPAVVEDVKPKTKLADAAATFQKLKGKRSLDTQRKVRLLLTRLCRFLATLGKVHIEDVTLADLIEFRDGWNDAHTTQRRNQELLRSFFTFCVESGHIAKSPAKALDPIPKSRPKTDPFTLEEMQAIIQAFPLIADEYGRHGGHIAKQTRAFVLVMRYTGMSIGDTAKLEKRDVDGVRIRTYRKKTGEDVFARVPQFVINALNEAPHDSGRYFFWSGKGLLHTRASKWSARLQRLFVLAGVQTTQVLRRPRMAGKLTAAPRLVTISLATPHMFRHTLVRDLLDRENPASLEEIAELLGNSMRTVEMYYSKWDRRRQARLEAKLEGFWREDELTKLLTSPDHPIGGGCTRE